MSIYLATVVMDAMYSSSPAESMTLMYDSNTTTVEFGQGCLSSLLRIEEKIQHPKRTERGGRGNHSLKRGLKIDAIINITSI